METINEQLNKAIEQYTQGKYHNCLSLLTTIMTLYLQTEDWENYAQALHYTLECKYQTTDYNEALILWQQTLPIVQTHCPPQTPIWIQGKRIKISSLNWRKSIIFAGQKHY